MIIPNSLTHDVKNSTNVRINSTQLFSDVLTLQTIRI